MKYKNRFFLTGLFFVNLCQTSFSLSFGDIGNVLGQSTDAKNLALNGAKKLFTPQVLPEYPQENLDDKTISDYSNKVLKNLETNAIHKGFDVILLKTAKVNGFAYFGSQDVVVTRGLLNMMKSEAELACLFGHEIGHIDLGHDEKVYHQSYVDSAQSKGIVLIGRALGQGEATDTAEYAKQNMTVANYGQQLEQDADEYGAVLAAKAGYDPYAFVDLFKRLAEKRGTDLGVHLNALTEGHKSSDARAQHLEEFLEAKGYKPGQGKRNEKEFQTAMAGLAYIHTGEDGGGSPVLNDDEKKELADLEQVQTEIQKYSASGKSMEVKRFLDLMAKLSDSCRKHGITRKDIQGSSFGAVKDLKKFMDDNLSQDSPYSSDTHKPDFEKRIKNAILHLVVGGMPLGGNIIGMDEGITGKDFYTGENLNVKDRVMAFIGGVAVQTGVDEKLDAGTGLVGEGTNIKSYGDSLQSISKDLSNAIDQSTANSFQGAGKILDNGTDWKRIDDGSTPAQEGVYQMKTNSDQTYYQVETKNGTYLLDHNPNADDNLGSDVQGVERIQVPSGTSLEIAQENGRIIYKQ
jgi:Zn-dependent protease with chaperone function